MIQFLPTSPAFYFFFFNDTATTEIYPLSLHDALPISRLAGRGADLHDALLDLRHFELEQRLHEQGVRARQDRSEEHTSELQSRLHLVCRLLLEKKKKPAHRLARTRNLRTILQPAYLQH